MATLFRLFLFAFINSVSNERTFASARRTTLDNLSGADLTSTAAKVRPNNLLHTDYGDVEDVTVEEQVSQNPDERLESLSSLKTGGLTGTEACGFGRPRDLACRIKEYGIDEPIDQRFIMEYGKEKGWRTPFPLVLQELIKHMIQSMIPEAKAKYDEWYDQREQKSISQVIYGDKLNYALEEFRFARSVRELERIFQKYAGADGKVAVTVLLEKLQLRVPFMFREIVATQLKRFFPFYTDDTADTIEMDFTKFVEWAEEAKTLDYL